MVHPHIPGLIRPLIENFISALNRQPGPQELERLGRIHWSIGEEFPRWTKQPGRILVMLSDWGIAQS
jgi:hypothetical protein